MRFNLFPHFSVAHNKRTALIMALFLATGCSSNTMRFADGMFTNSTSAKQAESKPMPPQPIPDSVAQQNYPIESNSLPPVESATASQAPEMPEAPVQVAGLGAPPRNLGTLPASEVRSPVINDNNKAGERYIVQSGDTLSRIAARRGVSVSKIREVNGLSSNTIRIGQALTLPGSASNGASAKAMPTEVASAQPVSTPVIQPVVYNTSADNTASTSPTQATSLEKNQASSAPEQTAKANTPEPEKAASTPQNSSENQQVAAIVPPANGVAGLRWPAKGRILSSFGQREGTLTNDGVDIMIPEGTAVKAAESGVVIYAGDGLKEFGNTILIRHEDNLVTVYGHNGQLLVSRGQKVRRGDEIAKSGKSGNTTTPKLHFEVRKNSTPVNPMKYLES